MSQKYGVICQSVIGGMDRGFTIDYGFDGEFFNARDKAIRHGFRLRDSDDFNIVVVEDGRVTSFDWMSEPVGSDAEEMLLVQSAVFP